MNERHVARDISYAYSAQTRPGRALIRIMENATGRLGLIRQAKGYEQEVAEGRDFWDVMAERYRLKINLVGGSFENIPRQGPLILVANHPYGILDGLMLGQVLSQTRGDFRIIAHRVFRKAPDLANVILPISFDATREAQKLNMDTRAEALRYLSDGGAIGIFPGGTVSTGARPFSRPMDPVWRSFTARMVARSDAVVVPVFFDGANSRLFQIASHLHATLRMGLLIREFRARVGTDVDVVIGAPIPAAALADRRSDAKAMMDLLRTSTYELSPKPVRATDLGYEFEDNHKVRHGSGNIR